MCINSKFDIFYTFSSHNIFERFVGLIDSVCVSYRALKRAKEEIVSEISWGFYSQVNKMDQILSD